MSKESKLTWAQVLGMVQAIAPTEGWAFTTSDLVQAGLDPKEAAKWLSKFVDWGYLRRGDFETDKIGIGGRPRRLYHMLKRGLEKDVTAIGLSDVEKLTQAIQLFRDARGQEGEAQAVRNLFKVHDTVLADRENRFKKKE